MEVNENTNEKNAFVPKYKQSVIKYQKSILEEYNLDKIGTIRYAKIHSSANRPLKKKEGKDFNRSTNFCKCCNLPEEQYGILEKFNCSDNPDSFVECGEVVSLYFTFFRFAAIIMLVTFILSCIYNIIFSTSCTKELSKICNDYYNNFNNIYKAYYEYDCKLYLNSKDENYSLYYSSLNHFYQFNIHNTQNYRNISIINKKNELIDKIIVNTSLINFLSLITLFIINIIFIILVNYKSKIVNISVLSPSDYSVFIYNLYNAHQKFLEIKNELLTKKKEYEKKKIEFNLQEELYNNLGIDKFGENISELEEFKCFIKNMICKGQKYNIKKVNICFKISELMKYEKKLQKIYESIDKIENHPYQILKNERLGLIGEKKKYFESFWNYFDCHCCESSTTMKALQDKEKQLKNEINELMDNSKKNTMKYFGGCAVISFDSIEEHENFLSHKKNNIFFYIKIIIYYLCGCCCSNKRDAKWFKRGVIFEKAPEPEDIIYENLEYNNSLSKFFRVIIVYVCSIILIFISLIIVTLLNYLQQYCDEKKYHPAVRYIISFLITCCIQIINIIFRFFLDKLTKVEKRFTSTSYHLSYSIKLTFFSFLNSGIVPWLSHLYNGAIGFQYLIINIFMILLVNATLTPISWTMNFTFFIKKFKIWLIERKDDPDSEHGKTQRELNELYELPSMDISAKYSYIFKTLLISNFFISIFPFGPLFSFAGFLFGYFLEKYNFCHRYKRPEMLNDEICKLYLNYFITVLFVNSLGDYIFKFNIYNTNIWGLINLIVFGILIFIPYHDYVTYDFLKLKESKVHPSKLDDVYLSFFTDYERANPMTKKEGIESYLKALKDKGKIDEDFYNKCLENLINVNLMKLYYNDRKNQNILKIQKTLMSKANKKNKTNLIYVKTLKTIKSIVSVDLDDMIKDNYEYGYDEKLFLDNNNVITSNNSKEPPNRNNKNKDKSERINLRGNLRGNLFEV